MELVIKAADFREISNTLDSFYKQLVYKQLYSIL